MFSNLQSITKIQTILITNKLATIQVYLFKMKPTINIRWLQLLHIYWSTHEQVPKWSVYQHCIDHILIKCISSSGVRSNMHIIIQMVWIPSCATLLHVFCTFWCNIVGIIGGLTERVRYHPIMSHTCSIGDKFSNWFALEVVKHLAECVE